MNGTIYNIDKICSYKTGSKGFVQPDIFIKNQGYIGYNPHNS